MLKEIKFQWEEKNQERQTRRIIKELALKMSCEILSRGFNKTSKDSWEISEINSNKVYQKVLNETSTKIFGKMMESLPEILPDNIYNIIYYHCIRIGITFDLIFEHFYHRDVLDGKASPEERKFVQDIKKIIHSYKGKDVKTGFEA